MIWTGLLILDSSAKSSLSFSLAVGTVLGFYVWSVVTITIVLIYLILLALTKTSLVKQLLRFIILCMGATVVPLVLHTIMSFFLDSLMDATSYENGGKQSEIINSIFFLAPSVGVFIGLALGRWLYRRIGKS